MEISIQRVSLVAIAILNIRLIIYVDSIDLYLARKISISHFINKKTSILLVTDVAVSQMKICKVEFIVMKFNSQVDYHIGRCRHVELIFRSWKMS